jgi:hypothetical protein
MRSSMLIIVLVSILCITKCAESHITDELKNELQSILDSYQSQLTQTYLNALLNFLDTVLPTVKILIMEWFDNFITIIINVLSGESSPLDLIEPFDYLGEIIDEVRKTFENVDDYTQFLNELFQGMQIQNPFGRRNVPKQI